MIIATLLFFSFDCLMYLAFNPHSKGFWTVKKIRSMPSLWISLYFFILRYQVISPTFILPSKSSLLYRKGNVFPIRISYPNFLGNSVNAMAGHISKQEPSEDYVSKCIKLQVRKRGKHILTKLERHQRTKLSPAISIWPESK